MIQDLAHYRSIANKTVNATHPGKYVSVLASDLLEMVERLEKGENTDV